MLDYALDALVAVLLAATVGHCTVLHRKLARLRTDQEGLGKLIANFAAATERAQAGLVALKSAGDEAETGLQANVARAIPLRDDLEFLAKQGARVADRLEALLAEGRSIVRPGGAAAEAADAVPARAVPDPTPAAEETTLVSRRAAAVLPRSRAELDLLRVLRGHTER
jgi:Domain of unknown function (DUF6468)